MDLGLEGKVAIVTGASLGIGKDSALVLAQEGADLAICARNVERLEEAAQEIRSQTGRKVLAVRADMTVPEDIKNLVASTIAEYGRVDILVNNAVNSRAALFEDLTDADWMNHINTKVMGYIRCMREVIPHMQSRGYGRIINMAGGAAREVSEHANSNGVTNAGIASLTKNLANRFAKDGILINCIHPGALTPRGRQFMEARAISNNTTLEEEMEKSAAVSPIRRLVQPEEIGYFVAFLCSNQASAITGQTVSVNGGAGQGIHY